MAGYAASRRGQCRLADVPGQHLPKVDQTDAGACDNVGANVACPTQVMDRRAGLRTLVGCSKSGRDRTAMQGLADGHAIHRRAYDFGSSQIVKQRAGIDNEIAPGRRYASAQRRDNGGGTWFISRGQGRDRAPKASLDCASGGT